MAVPPVPSEPLLFEAVITPPRGLGRAGLRALALLLALPAAGAAALFAALGAWPVTGFLGGELGLVLGLIALHRRRSARRLEIVQLTAGRLTVTRCDGRGRREEESLDPYWSRVALRERAGAACELHLTAPRRRAVEIGRDLGDAERRDLAAALSAALRRYREPLFDNPQLRE
ncbi:DUF2244 domain-containing protein [Caldovatus aquaticus]|uniref:DUF2244 domain-containing protein n=1 Tax=Caldovatus aquaticus TaxID=2865671 RepID=A0ABS7F0Q4_9PROT|nr:DUF2244 domain-containing protein [Caldovatus aquaticus]MBW8269210.1 DUF2244 domain-containing protein [Caldovatus aquaticus]